MRVRIATMVLGALWLSACGGHRGIVYQQALQIAGPPNATESRVVVFRDKPPWQGLYKRGWPVALDGEPMGDLQDGTYVSRDRPAGHHELSLELWDFPGVTRYGFETEPGKTYFFVVDLSTRGKAVGYSAFLGLVGVGIATLATSGGSFEFTPLDEAKAKERTTTLEAAEN